MADDDLAAAVQGRQNDNQGAEHALGLFCVAVRDKETTGVV
jgi:hypothetical protein